MELELKSPSSGKESIYELVLLSPGPPESPGPDDVLSPCHSPGSVRKAALSNIRDFVETTIVLKKDKGNELGICVAGGNDTYLEQVCVTEIIKDGAAYMDGRLRKGDVLLAVNDASLRDVTSNDAINLLREATSPLRLLVLRENPLTLFTTNESPTKFITVELRKANIKERLGISILQRVNGRGVFITYVEPGSIAAHHSRKIMQGDQILEINGQNVWESNQKDVAQMIRELDGAIVLLIGRVPDLTVSIQEWARKKAQQSLRTRTSTWSSYTANAKEKLATQRPSLPVSKDIYTLGFPNWVTNLVSPSSDQPSEISRTSSVRKTRLSIVTEDKNVNDSETEEDDSHAQEDEFINGNSENPLLPFIKVTSF